MYLGICQHCKTREATHSYTSVINGVVMESKLCDECYLELYGSIESAFSMWSNILQSPKPVAEKRCSFCGMTFSEYERTGLLGCASCYDVFKEELVPHIMKIQGDINHVGKVGKNYTSHDLTREINDLQQKLERAVRDKNYGEADKLNKRIMSLNKRLNGGEND